MNSFLRILVATMILSVWFIGFGTFSAAAQGTADCADNVLTTWQDSTYAVLRQYREAITEADDISVVAKLQAMRRQIEALKIPDCAVKPSPKLFVDMLNITADAMVARLNTKNNDSDNAAKFQAEAERQHKIVSGQYVGYEPPSDTVLTATIDSFKDGDEVEVSEQIQGTFDPSPLQPGQYLWLFVYAPNGKYYPQVTDACPDSPTTTTTIIPRRNHNTWTMTAYMGAEGDHGKSFDLILMIGDEAATKDIYARFPAWCPNSFTGLTDNEITDLGLKELASVTVTRK